MAQYFFPGKTLAFIRVHPVFHIVHLFFCAQVLSGWSAVGSGEGVVRERCGGADRYLLPKPVSPADADQPQWIWGASTGVSSLPSTAAGQNSGELWGGENNRLQLELIHLFCPLLTTFLFSLRGLSIGGYIYIYIYILHLLWNTLCLR